MCAVARSALQPSLSRLPFTILCPLKLGGPLPQHNYSHWTSTSPMSQPPTHPSQFISIAALLPRLVLIHPTRYSLFFPENCGECQLPFSEMVFVMTICFNICHRHPLGCCNIKFQSLGGLNNRHLLLTDLQNGESKNQGPSRFSVWREPTS